VPLEYARRSGVTATSLTDGRLEIALAPGADMGALLAELSGLFRCEVVPSLAPRHEIENALDRCVRQRPEYLERAAGELVQQEFAESMAQVERVTDFNELMRRAPVVKLVSLLIAQAVRTGSTDIHFQPMGDCLRVRFRTDGILHDILDLPRSARDGIMSRIKVLGQMDIAERRAPQDGRASFRYADREIDVRMSVVPTSEGERAVLRLLDKQQKLLALEDLGLDQQNLAAFEEMIHYSHGMVLVTGPTGSGKTTTLYAALNRINSPELNIITIEDPVEYKLDGVSQIQVLPRKNVTFGSMLRSIVRQDPNIIMIGEIRDAETAAAAVQSALTGHLMFSTLHTNDAPGAVARLLDLGVEPFLISSALLAVLAQRLVRRVCEECAEPDPVPPARLEALGISRGQAADARLRRGRGCSRCLGTGYRGRVGIFELLIVDDAVRRLINSRASSAEIRELTTSSGMKMLRADGALKAMAGLTTVEEVLRVTQRDST
jgi:type II secretory ATPase GspE/PulE/Tfp pilus assembly ATPase PilB-like protein